MKIFRTKWLFVEDHPIDGNPIWQLPVIAKCPECGWGGGAQGLHYPNIFLDKIPGLLAVHKCNTAAHGTVEWSQFNRILEVIRPHVRADLPITQNTFFGPTRGKVVGKAGDFSTPDSRVILIQEAALAKLREHGIVLPAYPADIKGAKASPAKWYDVEAPAVARLASKAKVKVCPSCSRRLELGSFVILKSSIPAKLHVFRAVEDTERVLISGPLADALATLKLTGIPLSPVEIADE